MSRPALRELRSLVLDVDGVLMRGSHRLPGAAELLELLDRQGTPFVLLTNNSSRTATQVSAHLLELGLDVTPERILTSSAAAAMYLRRLRPQGGRVFVIGEEGLSQPLQEAGFEPAESGDADYVVLGVDRGINYEKLKRATLLLRAGVPFIATNPDTTYPSPEGLVPGAGALIAALTAASGIAPLVIGKPSPSAFQMALLRVGGEPATSAAIGDRLDTDIAGGKSAGMWTILVLSGVSTRQELAASSAQPDWVFDSLELLADALR